jgi:hypothetical protein
MKKIIILIGILIGLFFLLFILTKYSYLTNRSLEDNYWIFPLEDAKELNSEEMKVYKSDKVGVYKRTFIKGNLISVVFDSNFILIIRSNKSTEVPLSKLIEENKEYFILIKNKDILLGPFDRDRFIEECTYLSISNKLRLELTK